MRCFIQNMKKGMKMIQVLKNGFICFCFLMIIPASLMAEESELVIVFTGDTIGYVEPCG